MPKHRHIYHHHTLWKRATAASTKAPFCRELKAPRQRWVVLNQDCTRAASQGNGPWIVVGQERPLDDRGWLTGIGGCQGQRLCSLPAINTASHKAFILRSYCTASRAVTSIIHAVVISLLLRVNFSQRDCVVTRPRSTVASISTPRHQPHLALLRSDHR